MHTNISHAHTGTPSLVSLTNHRVKHSLTNHNIQSANQFHIEFCRIPICCSAFSLPPSLFRIYLLNFHKKMREKNEKWANFIWNIVRFSIQNVSFAYIEFCANTSLLTAHSTEHTAHTQCFILIFGKNKSHSHYKPLEKWINRLKLKEKNKTNETMMRAAHTHTHTYPPKIKFEKFLYSIRFCCASQPYCRANVDNNIVKNTALY